MTEVTIVIPAYNEGVELAANLVTIADHLHGFACSYAFDFVVVDDGSTDESYDLACRFARFRKNVTVLHFERNRGLGAALRAGFEHARGEYVVAVDADLSYRVGVIIELLDAIEAENADIAMASAYMPGGTVANVPWTRKILSREANRFLSLATNGRYSTLTCMVRAYRRSFLTRLHSGADGMEVSPELVFAALRAGGKVIEVPAALEWSFERAAGTSRLNWRRLFVHVGGVLRCGLRYRPALYLAIPGLFPGLLPLVIAAMLLSHVSAQVFALGTVLTVLIQYTSLAVFAGQAASFFGTAFFTRRRQAARYSKP
ncbi:MAG TPA: glycosyltransferase family 2 protein [Candidatus Baltobacteraceae bacterium]|jgi:dolichol-phosphate mannosyltransferase